MTYHLIATTTVTRLKRHQASLRAPQIIVSGTFDECLARAAQIAPGRAANFPAKELLLGEISVFSTDTWTYYIVAGGSLAP